MWRRTWSNSKSNFKIHLIPSGSSLKDIEYLCSSSTSNDNNHPDHQHTKLHQPLFHRPLVASSSSLLRTLSSPISFPSSPTSSPEPEPEPEPQPQQESNQEQEQVQVQVQEQPVPCFTGTESNPHSIPNAENRIVVYFTSLRVVRSTFEDCRAVQSILRGLRRRTDERDVSMDSNFITDLHASGIPGKSSLPQVFIDGRYVGGAEETKRLNEIGELKKMVEGLPEVETGVCPTCGGYAFVLCSQCDGSHKVYVEKSGFRSCTACNENGLIRCPSCSSSSN